jgi:hypothetical protein
LKVLATGARHRRTPSAVLIGGEAGLPQDASVHISNILSQLGVSTLIEAAGVAHRLGIYTLPGAAEVPSREI